MIYRTVFAVVLALALVGVTLQPLDTARRDRASMAVSEQIEGFERTSRGLVATDDPTAGQGARRVVTFRLPARQWTIAGIDHVVIRPKTDDGPASVAWQVRGRPVQSRVLHDLPIGTTDGIPVRFRSAGTHRLVLALDGRPGSPVVTVRRLK